MWGHYTINTKQMNNGATEVNFGLPDSGILRTVVLVVWRYLTSLPYKTYAFFVTLPVDSV